MKRVTISEGLSNDLDNIRAELEDLNETMKILANNLVEVFKNGLFVVVKQYPVPQEIFDILEEIRGGNLAQFLDRNTSAFTQV